MNISLSKSTLRQKKPGSPAKQRLGNAEIIEDSVTEKAEATDNSPVFPRYFMIIPYKQTDQSIWE